MVASNGTLFPRKWQCERCGIEWEGRKRRFCSRECQWRHGYRRSNPKVAEQATCLYCQKQFSRKRRAGKNKQFCSESHRSLWFSKKRQIECGPCVFCGARFKGYADQRFCSGSCAGKWQHKQAGNRLKTESRCKQCGKDFMPKAADRQTFCSRACAFASKTKYGPPTPAPRCGRCQDVLVKGEKRYCLICKPMMRKPGIRYFICPVCTNEFYRCKQGMHGKYCSPKCRNKAAKKRNNLAYRMSRRTRQKRIQGGDKIDPCQVFARDNHICRICFKPVKMNAELLHPLSPTVDHIIPLGNGGKHTMENVQCAHRGCNIKRSNKKPAYARLFS